MICNVSPSHQNYGKKQLNTLKFAQRMKKVENKKARTNVSSQHIASIKRELSKLSPAGSALIPIKLMN